MNEFSARLETLFEYFSVTSSQFAEAIGVQKSSISHILSERNKPSLDFILKVKEAFPEISLHWLIYGTLPFLETSATAQTVEFQAPEILVAPTTSSLQEDTQEPLSTAPHTQERIEQPQPTPNTEEAFSPLKSGDIETIVIFYKDGSFKNYTPR